MAAAAVHRDGRPLRFATGERSILSGNRVTTEDVWHLGSITKSITATLVARLVDAGQIKWDDTVGAALGKAVPDMQAQYRDATFRHLLSHRSGLPGDIPALRFAGFTLHDSADVIGARLQYASIALGLKPLHALEAAYLYANNGYVVAGAMLEARLGETTEALTRRHVFESLGLGTAGFGPPGRFGELTQPVGHADDMDMKLLRVVGIKALKPQSPGMPQTDNPVPLGPAGRAHMSLDDVLRYLEAHRDRTSFLTPASWDVLHTPPFGGNYAMGWMRRADGSLWHNGSNNRWYAEVLFNSSTGLAACAVANEARPAACTAVSRALQEVAAT
jgi:CubicO group peptidase (beta-lactamase class C family)